MIILRFYFWTVLGHLMTFWKLNPVQFIWGLLTAPGGMLRLLAAPRNLQQLAVRAGVRWLEENSDKAYPAWPKFVMGRLRLLVEEPDVDDEAE
jgi:hypothetical protein